MAKKLLGVGDVQISKLAKKYINQIIDTKRITYGKFISGFEKEFSQLHHVKYSIFCNSGTSALQASLHALKAYYNWKDNDEIIVPALTFVATINTVLQNNLKPVFVDVEPDYFMIDPLKIIPKISSRTKAIIPVHIAGQPADMNPIMKIANKYKLKVIEDSCETVFARYKNKPVGSFGEFSCFSTYAAHILITGVGGMICTNNASLAVKAKSLVNHGRDGIYTSIDDDQLKKGKELFDIVERRFNFIDTGYSYRATEFEGALGLAQLKNWKNDIKKRLKNVAYLTKGLKDLETFLQLPKIRSESEHVFMFYPMIVINKKIEREKLVFYLEKNLIETRYLLPLLSQPIYKKIFGDIDNQYPIAQNLSKNGFYIGCHPGLKKEDLDYIIYKFHQFFSSRNH